MMIKVSELVSKQLLCLDTASVAGTISNVIFDERLKCGVILQLFCEDDDNAETLFVQLKNITAVSENAAVVKSADCVLREWDYANAPPNNPINCPCYNQDGKLLGAVRDIEINGIIVEKIILDNVEFSPKELLSFSPQLLIFNDSGKPIKVTKPKIKFPTPTDYASAHIHDSVIPTPVKPPDKIDVPPKISSADQTATRQLNYKFLLGKPVHSAIVGKNGKILIPAGQVVSEATIKLASENGKLVQLALRAY